MVDRLRRDGWRVELIYLMNDGENPELVFEQCGDQRDILRADHYQLLLEKAER